MLRLVKSKRVHTELARLVTLSVKSQIPIGDCAKFECAIVRALFQLY